MNEADFDIAINEYEKSGRRFHSAPSRDKTAIDRCANTLGLVFPEPLRRIFERYEVFAFAADEFIDIDEIVTESRGIHRSRKHVPNFWVPFLRDGSGGWYFVVCAPRGKEPSSDFGCIYHNPGEFPNTLDFDASDVWTFLVQRLQFWTSNP